MRHTTANECANKWSFEIEGFYTAEFFIQQKDELKAKITLQYALITPEIGQNLLLSKQSVATMQFAYPDELVTKSVTRFELENKQKSFHLANGN